MNNARKRAYSTALDNVSDNAGTTAVMKMYNIQQDTKVARRR